MSNSDMILVLQGKPYPLPLPSTNEGQMGAAAQFLRKEGNILQVIVPNMSKDEEKALTFGKISTGLLYKNGAMLFLFQVHNDNDVPILLFDAPFDARIIPAEDRELHNIDNNHPRIGISIHGVDEKRITRVLRDISMPPELTLEFLSLAQDQLAETRKGTEEIKKWYDMPLDKLINTTRTWILGK